MTIHIRLFAHMAQQAGEAHLSIEVPADATLATVRSLLEKKYPSMRWPAGLEKSNGGSKSGGGVMFAVNQEYSAVSASCGTMMKWRLFHQSAVVESVRVMPEAMIDIQLFETPLDSAAAIRRVTSPEAGGIDIFIGTTRAETHAEMGPLVHLDYHAYNEMALAEMKKLADQAKARWPMTRLVMWHRLGVVSVGEASVVIAVSCPHRGDAFAACRFLIDALKETVPIWKKEVYAKSTRWQGDV